MTHDLIIVADEKDAIRRYVYPIMDSLRYVKPDVRIKISNLKYHGRNDIPKTKKILFLLSGSVDRAEEHCNRWFKYLQSQRDIGRKYLTITICNEEPEATADDGHGPQSNILTVRDIDLVEEWIPRFVKIFFNVRENHESLAYIRNMSPEYKYANIAGNSLNKSLQSLGFHTQNTDKRNQFIVIRSRLVHEQDTINEIEALRKGNNHDCFHVISSQLRSEKRQVAHLKVAVHGRSDIVTCIIMAMTDIGVIQKQTDFGNLTWKCNTYLSSLFACVLSTCAKIFFSCILLIMHGFYVLSVLPISSLTILCSYSAFYKYSDERVPKVFITISHIGASCGWSLCTWYAGFMSGSISAPMAIYINISIVLYYIVFYTVLNIWLAKRYSTSLESTWRYECEYGIFSLPFIWWKRTYN